MDGWTYEVLMLATTGNHVFTHDALLLMIQFHHMCLIPLSSDIGGKILVVTVDQYAPGYYSSLFLAPVLVSVGGHAG